MRKLILIFFLLVIGLTSKSFGQNTCNSAIVIVPTDSTLFIDLTANDTVNWVKFVATDTAIYLGVDIVTKDSGYINSMTLYYAPNNCNGYTQIIQNNGVTIHYGSLTIGNTYLLKVNNNGKTALIKKLGYFKKINNSRTYPPDPHLFLNFPEPLNICLGTKILFYPAPDYSPSTTTFYIINTLYASPILDGNNNTIGVYFDCPGYCYISIEAHDIINNYPFTDNREGNVYMASNFTYTVSNCKTVKFEGNSCSSDPLCLSYCSYYYDFGDGTTITSSTPNLSHTYTAPGTHTYQVTYTVYLNCPHNTLINSPYSETVYQWVTVSVLSPVVFSPSSPQSINVGASLPVTASVPGSTITNWVWSSSPPGFNATTPSVTLSPSNYTIYNVVGKEAGGDCHSGDFVVCVNTPILFNQPNPSAICFGNSIPIAASLQGGLGITSCQWSLTGSSVISFNTANVTISPTTTGQLTYDIVIIDVNGCQHTGTFTLNVVQLTTPIISGNNLNCIDPIYSVSNPSTISGVTYTWSVINGLSNGPQNTIFITQGNPTVNIQWDNNHLSCDDLKLKVVGSIGNCSSMSTINIIKCCGKQNTFNTFNNFTIDNNNNSNYTNLQGTFYINGTLTIKDNSHVYFQKDIPNNDYTYIKFGENAKIIVEPGSSLTINHCNLSIACCEKMWDGIYLSDNTSLIDLRDSYIEYSINGIIATNNTNVTINQNVFNRNWTSVNIINTAYPLRSS